MPRSTPLPNMMGLASRAWRALPDQVTTSAPATVARREVLTRLRGAPPVEVRVIRTIAALDEVLAELDEAGRRGDDDLRAGFDTFRFEADVTLPEDPWSPEYRRAVLDLYEHLRGEPYAVTNEYTVFDLDRAAGAPFPYLTASGKTVGEHLIAVGHLIRTLELPARSRVLELEAGWGNVTLALAQMGHDVTAIDISPDFVELIRRRAGQVGAAIDVRVGDFAAVDDLAGGYDAVVFFESFHHAADHRWLLDRLDGLVAPGGRVVFAAEPVTKSFPVPWGLRLDGESVWAIRRNGWLELGFRRSYFDEALARAGWRARVVSCPETYLGEVFVATRR